MNKNSWLLGFFGTLFGTAIGFAISMSTVAREVSTDRANIVNLARQLEMEQTMRRDADLAMGVRVDNVSQVIQRTVDQNTQIIALINAQTRILNK